MNAKAKKYLQLAPLWLVSLFLLLASGLPKIFINTPEFAAFGAQLGLTPGMALWIGLLEVATAILLVIPRTATLGFLMLVGLLGGAMATTLTHTAEGAWWWFPLILLALVMVTAYNTLPELLDRAKGKSVPNTKSRALRIFSWVLVFLLLAMHAMALMGKINPPAEGTPEYAMAAKLGMVGLEFPLLIVEVVTLVLFLVPRTSAIGAVLMIGYMGGVLATILTHDLNDPAAPVQVGRLAASMPGFVMVAVAAIAVWIRNPELAQRLVKGKYPA